MTDEEMAEEYADKNKVYIDFDNDISDYGNVKKAFLAGLKAGKDMAEADLATVAYMQGAERYKTKWHKVTDRDYPPYEKGGFTVNVFTDRGEIAYYNHFLDSWISEPASAEIAPPVAWCEIPKYKE